MGKGPIDREGQHHVPVPDVLQFFRTRRSPYNLASRAHSASRWIVVEHSTTTTGRYSLQCMSVELLDKFQIKFRI
jgi:hypothetical protein